MDTPDIIAVSSVVSGCIACLFTAYMYCFPRVPQEQNHNEEHETRRRELSILENISVRLNSLLRKNNI